jgi:hypothetical protein
MAAWEWSSVVSYLYHHKSTVSFSSGLAAERALAVRPEALAGDLWLIVSGRRVATSPRRDANPYFHAL